MFEKVFEDMQVKTDEIDAGMNNIYQGTISNDEVAALIGEIKDENAMATGAQMEGVGTGQIANPNAQPSAV